MKIGKNTYPITKLHATTKTNLTCGIATWLSLTLLILLGNISACSILPQNEGYATYKERSMHAATASTTTTTAATTAATITAATTTTAATKTSHSLAIPQNMSLSNDKMEDYYPIPKIEQQSGFDSSATNSHGLSTVKGSVKEAVKDSAESLLPPGSLVAKDGQK